MYSKYFKRVLDFTLSLIALILLSPIFLMVAVLVRVKLGSPVIFCQERPGKDEKIFKLYKFRSMTDQRDENGKLLPDEVRLTRFGRQLRATSLDELPELWNIVRGDMAIVGPRPLLIEYIPWYTTQEKHRHDVRPGLTGWAQINGRNYIDWDTRFKLDVEYVENITLKLDVKIVFLTIKKVLCKSDIAENTNQIEGNFAKIREAEINK